MAIRATMTATPFRALLGLVVALWVMASGTAMAAPAEWSRPEALRALASVDLDPTVARLEELTVTGDQAALLGALDGTARRADWPSPARDAALYRYAVGLGRLPADAVPSAALRWLEAYQPQALVPHEDHGGGRVPLFNVRAATAGAIHTWLRREALLEGLALVRAQPRGLVDVFALESHPAARAGYVATLGQVSPEQLRAINAAVAGRLERAPALTPLAARAAALERDPAALEHVLAHGAGPAVHWMLSDVAQGAPPDLQRDLLDAALRRARPETTALAIARLYPALAGQPAVDEALLARLGDEDLGAAAALALAGSPSPETRRALEVLAAEPGGLASRRANLALRLRPDAQDGQQP
jgi:hypothetical protein